MSVVYLGLGSNINRHENLRAGLNFLKREFSAFEVSSVFESEAIGFDGKAFFNCVVRVDTDLSLKSLAEKLRALEFEYGREANSSKFSSRTLDIDILLYDALVGTFDGIQLPRPEVTRNAFVLQPLQEIAPTLLHPELNISFAKLWESYDKKAQKLKKTVFTWETKPA